MPNANCWWFLSEKKVPIPIGLGAHQGRDSRTRWIIQILDTSKAFILGSPRPKIHQFYQVVSLYPHVLRMKCLVPAGESLLHTHVLVILTLLLLGLIMYILFPLWLESINNSKFWLVSSPFWKSNVGDVFVVQAAHWCGSEGEIQLRATKKRQGAPVVWLSSMVGLGKSSNKNR